MVKTFTFYNTTPEAVKTALMSIAPYIADQHPTWSDRTQTFEMAGHQNHCNYSLIVGVHSDNGKDTTIQMDFKLEPDHMNLGDCKAETEEYCIWFRDVLLSQIDGTLDYNNAGLIEVGKMLQAKHAGGVIALVVVVAIVVLIFMYV